MRYWTKSEEVVDPTGLLHQDSIHELIVLIDDIPPGVIIKFIRSEMSSWCWAYLDDESTPTAVGIIGQLYERPVNILRDKCLAFIAGWKARDGDR